MCFGFLFGCCFFGLTKNKRKQTERKVACGNKIEFLFKKLSTYFQLHNMQNTQHKSYDPNVSQVRIREWRRMCCKIENCKRTCTCTRVNPTPRHMWCNDNRRKSNSLIAEKKGNSKLEVSEINRLHNWQLTNGRCTAFFIQQMGHSHRISGISGSGVGNKRQGGRHHVLGGTSLLSKFWDNPPSLPLSEKRNTL